MNKAFKYMGVVFVIVGVFVAIASYKYLSSDNEVGPNLITAFVGVVISALVTLVLLSGQTKDEEEKERNLNLYKAKQKELNYLGHAMSLMHWDLETTCPDGGKEKLSDAISFFSTEHFKKATDDEFYGLVCKLSEKEEFDKLDDVMKFDITRTKEQLDKMRRVPQDFYEEYVKTITASSIAWPKAKQNNDWKSYEEPLEKTIKAVKEYKKYVSPDMQTYDALIDDYERGIAEYAAISR